jgi:hypothetical protein
VTVTNTGTSGATPTGTVTLQDTVYSVVGGVLNTTTTTLASNLTLDGNGNAFFSTSALTADKHFITVSYSGDSNFGAGNSSLIQVVHASASTTALTSSANPSAPGQQVTFTATVTALPPGSGTPTGQVTFEDGTTVIGQVPLNASGVAAFSTSSLQAGIHTMTAVYASDTNFAASSGSVAQSVQNSAATTTTTATSSPNPSTFGQPVTFTSTTTYSGGVPAGAVTFTEGATVWAVNVAVNASGQASFSTTTLSVGSHTITATFTGSTGWGNSNGNAGPQQVNSAATATAVKSSANPAVYSQTVTFTATVTAVAPGSGVPTGTVTFKNGSTTLGTGTLNGSGIATFSSSTLAVGSAPIAAVYGGSASFNTSTSPVLTQTVNQDGSTSTVTSSKNPSKRSQLVTFTATVVARAPGTATPTGTVTFKNGAATLASGSLSSGKATFSTSTLSSGKHQITVVYGGSSSFLTSTSAVLVQTVK